MIRVVNCPVCGLTIKYNDSDKLMDEANDFTTSLHHEDGTALETHVKYMVCPECASDVDIGELEIRYNNGKKCSMEIVYYGTEEMVREMEP